MAQMQSALGLSTEDTPMGSNALQTFIDDTRAAWGPLSSEVAASCRRHLEQLMQAPASESWLASLHEAQPASRELYRDAQDGFVLLAHAEAEGLYRPPHDHGRSWVIYAVQQGEMEMGTYARIREPDGRIRLVKRDCTIVRAGEAKVFLPGDIHDTCCVVGPALLFRFTERDLKKEDLEEHQVMRYALRNGVFTVPEP
ncbi:MAG: hypothetical protein WBW32_02350 [Luteibacter sp.]